jgi:hypothetical protein
LEKSFSDNHFEKIISNDSLNSGNSVINENESEKLVLRNSNSEVKIVNNRELRMEKQDDNLDDKVTNSSVILCLISETIFVTLAPISVLINSATSPLKSISC